MISYGKNYNPFFRQKCTGCEGLLAVLGVTQSGMQRKEMDSHMSSKLRKPFFPTTEKKKSMRSEKHEGDLWYSCKLQELLQMKAYNTP